MKTLKLLTLAISLALFSTLALAQTVPGVTVSASLYDGQGNIQKTSYLHFELWNCGDNVPQLSGGTGAIVASQFDMRANPTTGIISGAIYGSDQIFCAAENSTEWLVTEFKASNTAVANPQYYCLTSGETFNPAVTQPCINSASIPVLAWDVLFGNYTATQTWTQPVGTQADLFGSFFLNGLPLGNPISLETNGIANGSQAALNIVAGSNVTLANTGGNVTISTPNVSGTVPQQAPPGNPFVNSTASTSGAYLAGVTYVTPTMNWSQVIASGAQNLTAGASSTITLPAGIAGIDVTSGASIASCTSAPYSGCMYQVYISDGSAETVYINGGTYTFAGGGTITFTPFFSHTAYTVESASAGIQETYNAACGTSGTYYNNVQCNVTIAANGPYTSSETLFSLNNYKIYGTIFIHGEQTHLDGSGVSLSCYGRGPCLQVGVPGVSSTHFNANVVSNLGFNAGVVFSGEASSYAGSDITTAACNGSYCLITTSAAHNLRSGDLATMLFTDNPAYWGDVAVYDCATTVGGAQTACTNASTTFRFATTFTITSASTPGVVALAYSAVLDNGFGTAFQDIYSDINSIGGRFNNFFDIWDDENLTIRHFNNGGGGLNRGLTWSGSYIFSAESPSFSEIIAPVINLYDTTITSQNNCLTVFNNNGTHTYGDFICQGQSLWQVNTGNYRGNFGGTHLDNVYSEGTSNPGSPSTPLSPYPGLGTAGWIVGGAATPSRNSFTGEGTLLGVIPSGNSGATVNKFTYYIVANDPTPSPATQTSPMQILNWNSPGTGTGSDAAIVISWPRIASWTTETAPDAINYDVLRCSQVGAVGSVYPYTGGTPGGSVTACGPVATAVSQSSACGNTLVCSYTDSGTAVTSTGYTVKLGTYDGTLSFWPGSLVVFGGNDSAGVIVDTEQMPVVGVGLHGNPAQTAPKCAGDGETSSGGYTSCWQSNTILNNAIKAQTAALLSDGAVQSPVGSDFFPKGRLNFTNVPGLGVYSHHIITLIDSQPGLTQATLGYRPPASVNDVWVGTDSNGSAGTAGQLAFGSPVSITNYIAHIGNGNTPDPFLERLTATLKEFNVAVKFDSYVDDVGTASAPADPASGNCRQYFNTSTGLETFINSSGGSCNPSNGGGVAWSALTSSSGNLSVPLSTYTTLFTESDLGASPVNGVYEITDAATSSTDTSTDFRVSVPAASYHESALFDVSGFSQLTVCNIDGSSHVGEVMVGNFASAALLPCPLLSTTPLNKLTVINNSNNRTELALVHTSNTGGGGNIMLRFLTASSNSGLMAFSVCAGTTNLDGSCNGTTTASLNDAGLFTGSFSGNLTGNASSASNASQLLGSTWANPPAFGTGSQNTGAFLALSATAFTASTSVTSPQYCIAASCITVWPSGAVTSVFTRTGAITAAAGDYSSFYPQLGTSGTPVNNVFYGNETFNGQITQICLTCANEYTATINTVALTAPSSGFSADGFDTTANGGLWYWCENGGACNYLTTVLAGKASTSGLVNTTTPIRDETYFVLAANMTIADGTVGLGTTGAGNSTFSWPVTGTNWYDLRCTLPVTFVSSATIRFQLYSVSGSVTVSNVNAETTGNTGASAALQNLPLIAGSSLATSETPVTGAPGGLSETISYDAQFLTSHAGNIGVEFVGNGANNVQLQLGGTCHVTQTN